MVFDSMVFVNGVLFGFGLAADAFLLSLSNGLNSPKTKLRKICAAASIFAVFQFAAPMYGWLCVHTLAKTFGALEKYIGWAAFAILSFMGFKMIYGGMLSGGAGRGLMKREVSGLSALIVQAMLTSVDALSVGFAASGLGVVNAAITSLIIACVTFALYIAGFSIGKRFGAGFAGGATVTGGLIMIAIGAEVLFGVLI